MKKRQQILLDIIIIGFISAIIIFLRLGSSPLLDPDEPRYAETARQMLITGDWVTPRFNGDVRWDKPPLFYWLVGFSYKLFGVSEWAARFPAALLGFLGIFITYWIGYFIWGRRTGFFSGLILATSLEYILVARLSITDMTLTFFILASLAFYLKTRGGDRRFAFWFWIVCALAVLTKGPIGILLPFLIIVVDTLISWKYKNLSCLVSAEGILAFLIIALSWFFVEASIHGREYLEYFFLEHNLGRFTADSLGHTNPVYFFIPVLAAGFFPWVFFLPRAIFQRCGGSDEAVIDGSRFILVWMLAVFIFFSLSTQKVVTYILPLYPAVALLVGNLFAEVIKNKKNLILEILLVVSFFSAAVIGVKVFGLPRLPEVGFYIVVVLLLALLVFA
ncbi:MAG: glycosyltransferase family 39 protein, partial [Candidatus Theseobacter exili]|nr:glycosyltransferase family 39 protein [Candidatus Theseobacter exili]